ncbi:hypothetical protein PAXRUDRAFT_400755 [Paxillus rubicundulus Ve08.2h10]|uniref:Uncharacterized protein n=1 Tax=Paxillus rubicundulus Ve08.2h10 TaxID=930991 RepID=A0A0D0D9B6_9AGAM|nr:hypothetical protein PAXRUDRAFT_400755 [Paxillus rubicundulus Ve08.2h10]
MYFKKTQVCTTTRQGKSLRSFLFALCITITTHITSFALRVRFCTVYISQRLKYSASRSVTPIYDPPPAPSLYTTYHGFDATQVGYDWFMEISEFHQFLRGVFPCSSANQPFSIAEHTEPQLHHRALQIPTVAMARHSTCLQMIQ